MGIGTGGAAAIGAGVSAAAGLGSAALGANAAGNAAGVQAQAADEAAQLQYQQAQQALGFEEQQYQNTLGLEEPQYLSGTEGLSTLDQLLGLPGQTPNTNIFSDPLGSLQQPGASTSSSFGGGLPGLGQIPLSDVPGLNGGNFMPMQAESAMRQNVPLSGLAPSAAGSGDGNPMVSNLSESALTPQQQAAEIEGFGGATQGGPVFNQTQGPITIGNQSGNTPVVSTLGGQSVPLSALDGTATRSQGGAFASPNPRFNPNAPVQGGPIRTIGPNGQPITGQIPGAGGAGAPGTGVNGTGLPAGFLSQTWNTPFVAPTAAQAAQMPGYQFQLQQGQQALQNSAAARGGLLSGGTAKALDQYSQGLASTDYQNLYNQALTQYQQAYNIFNQNQANVFNRYAALAGIGQTSAQQLSNAGLTTGSNVSNTLLTSGAQIGGDIQNAAAATASGYVGAANAYGGALSSLGGLANMIPLYNMLGNQNPNLITLNTGGSSVIPGFATDPTASPAGDAFFA